MPLTRVFCKSMQYYFIYWKAVTFFFIFSASIQLSAVKQICFLKITAPCTTPSIVLFKHHSGFDNTRPPPSKFCFISEVMQQKYLFWRVLVLYHSSHLFITLFLTSLFNTIFLCLDLNFMNVLSVTGRITLIQT